MGKRTISSAEAQRRPQPKPPQTAKGRQTREAILAALKRVLNAQGYYATTIGQVVAEAGVPTGSFYRYFIGKPEATLELVERLLASYFEAIPTAHDLTSFWQREQALQTQHAGLYESERGLLGCYFTYDTSTPLFADMFQAHTKRFLDDHILALAAVRPGCDLPIGQLRATMLALISMTETLTFRHFTARDPDLGLSYDQLLSAALRLRFRALFLIDPPGTQAEAEPAPRPLDTTTGPAAAAPPPAPRRRDSQATLDKIRQATLNLLDSLGYEELRLADIERASGITRGAIYHHFADKRDLVLSIIFERLNEITQALNAATTARRRTDDAYAALREVAEVHVAAFSTSRALMKTLYHLEEVDGDFAGRYQAIRSHWAALIARRIRAIGGSNLPAAPDVAALAFLAMSDRFLYDVYSLKYDEFDDLRETPADAAHLLALLWHRSLFGTNPKTGIARAA